MAKTWPNFSGDKEKPTLLIIEGTKFEALEGKQEQRGSSASF